MQHGQTIRKTAKSLFALAILGVVGACADNHAAPKAEAPAFVAPANYLTIGNSITFRVDNAQGITQRLEDHLLYIPAGAICDLVTSGYGQSMWNQPCTPLQGSILITATVLAGPKGEPYIDFQPSMRFAPNKSAFLFFREGESNAAQMFINWCDNLGRCFDESLTDASLKPFRIGTTTIIGRRIKHFTGYTVGYDPTGECPGTVVNNGDGTFYCDMGESSFQRRSGYIVASGEDNSDVVEMAREIMEKEGQQQQ